MLPIEVAFRRYLAGEISYEEYRRDHADPEEKSRFSRFGLAIKNAREGSDRG